MHHVDLTDVPVSEAAGEVIAGRPFCARRNGPVAMVMTHQYVVGELSLLLAQLRAAATNEVSARAVTLLRREAETLPPSALVSVAARAVALADRMCWASILRGDAAAFDRQATACAMLYEFGVCAGLLEDAPDSRPKES